MTRRVSGAWGKCSQSLISGWSWDSQHFTDGMLTRRPCTDRDEVSAALARIFNEMIFGDTPLHCDPHGGNIAIRKNTCRRKPNFDIILYDHGLYRDIPKQLRRDYAKLWLAVIDADEGNMRKYAYKVAGITNEDFPLFASVTCSFFPMVDLLSSGCGRCCGIKPI